MCSFVCMPAVTASAHYMCVCVCVHVCICGCVIDKKHARRYLLTHARNSRMHTCMHACSHARVYARYAGTYARTHARSHARMHARTHARTRACMHARTHTRTHAQWVYRAVPYRVPYPPHQSKTDWNCIDSQRHPSEPYPPHQSKTQKRKKNDHRRMKSVDSKSSTKFSWSFCNDSKVTVWRLRRVSLRQQSHFPVWLFCKTES